MVDGLRRAVDGESGIAKVQARAQASRALLAELPETAHCHATLQLPETCGGSVSADKRVEDN